MLHLSNIFIYYLLKVINILLYMKNNEINRRIKQNYFVRKITIEFNKIIFFFKIDERY